MAGNLPNLQTTALGGPADPTGRRGRGLPLMYKLTDETHVEPKPPMHDCSVTTPAPAVADRIALRADHGTDHR
jgi:hypothetical protein